MTIFAAIDTKDMGQAISLSQYMSHIGCGVKLGMQFFTAHGPDGVAKIKEKAGNAPIFLDQKWHDIPATVEKTCEASLPLMVDYVNVHTLGGSEMMKKAAEVIHSGNGRRGLVEPKILGVTILTSHELKTLEEIGMTPDTINVHVTRLAKLAQNSGLDGVVCSGLEIETLRQNCGQNFVLMVPGIRMPGSDNHDQKRVMTPLDAMKAGASHLVIGRDITGAAEPEQAARRILETLENI